MSSSADDARGASPSDIAKKTSGFLVVHEVPCCMRACVRTCFVSHACSAVRLYRMHVHAPTWHAHARTCCRGWASRGWPQAGLRATMCSRARRSGHASFASAASASSMLQRGAFRLCLCKWFWLFSCLPKRCACAPSCTRAADMGCYLKEAGIVRQDARAARWGCE